MALLLTPLAGEPEFDDPDQAGEWAGAMSGLTLMSRPWCFYAVREHGALLGAAGFKESPGANSIVEIAYLTLLPARGRGVATRATAALLEIAHDNGITRVRAHTLPVTNASTYVLKVNGFAGPVAYEDADDGPVWRWERAL